MLSYRDAIAAGRKRRAIAGNLPEGRMRRALGTSRHCLSPTFERQGHSGTRRLPTQERTMARGNLSREQQELADFLSQLSERSYRAGWMQGIEGEVWVAMHAAD